MQKDNYPVTISVIMPTYNTPHVMLEQSIKSILMQTYEDFEFIIIDDCSTDDSLEYLLSLKDSRIRVISNEKNMGITASLNIGLSVSCGKYIARMDSDDIALPERLQEQLNYMERHPGVIVCGTWIQAFGNSNYISQRHIPDNMEYFRSSLLFGNFYGLSHPTAFFRSCILRENGIKYDEEHLPTAQDYGMWVLCSKYGSIANVEKVLLYYRIHERQISIAKQQLQQNCTMYVQKQQLQTLLENVNDEIVKMHFEFCTENNVSIQMRRWFSKLIIINREKGIYDAISFENFVNDFINIKISNRARIISNIPELYELLKSTPLSKKKIILHILLKRIFHK